MGRWLPAIALLATVTLGGCAGWMDAMPDALRSGPWWKATQAADIRWRARELEAGGELTLALDHWRLVQRISIDPANAKREVSRLETEIAGIVRSHYHKGLMALKEKREIAARNHFLAALRLNPDFQPALRQIRAHFSPFPLAVYQSVAGDDPASVAKKVFDDENKAFLVAWFNDLPENQPLTTGTVLILPKLKKTTPEKTRQKQAPSQLTEARARLSENDFDGALALAKTVASNDPAAQQLTDSIHVRRAMVQIESGLLAAARQSLAEVPDGSSGKHAAQEKLQAAEQNRQTAAIMDQAREHFDQGRYGQCLNLVDRLIKITPDHLEAGNLSAEARYRLAQEHVDHKRFLDARQVLEQADEGHAASGALKKIVDARLNELAQIHYRNGVKHFIDEDLKSAIKEWEKALACNPNHEKARENIDNARRLLQKIESMP